MISERLIKNPDKCIECLKSMMGREDLIDMFAATYEHMFKAFKDDKPVLKRMREIVYEQVGYVYGFLVQRTEEGLSQGLRN